MDDLVANVSAVLSTTARRWLELTASIPVDLLSRPAAPGEWSAFQCLGHLVDTEHAVFTERVRAFLEGRDFPAFDPETEGRDRSETTPRQLAEEFARYRAESLALIEGLAPADLRRTATHSELGHVTLGQMLHEWAAHDMMHTVQGERALMQPFIAGTGPWRIYFMDHDLGGTAAG